MRGRWRDGRQVAGSLGEGLLGHDLLLDLGRHHVILLQLHTELGAPCGKKQGVGV